jgi:hypothetical protein
MTFIEFACASHQNSPVNKFDRRGHLRNIKRALSTYWVTTLYPQPSTLIAIHSRASMGAPSKIKHPYRITHPWDFMPNQEHLDQPISAQRILTDSIILHLQTPLVTPIIRQKYLYLSLKINITINNNSIQSLGSLPIPRYP